MKKYFKMHKGIRILRHLVNVRYQRGFYPDLFHKTTRWVYTAELPSGERVIKSGQYQICKAIEAGLKKEGKPNE